MGFQLGWGKEDTEEENAGQVDWGCVLMVWGAVPQRVFNSYKDPSWNRSHGKLLGGRDLLSCNTKEDSRGLGQDCCELDNGKEGKKEGRKAGCWAVTERKCVRLPRKYTHSRNHLVTRPLPQLQPC